MASNVKNNLAPTEYQLKLIDTLCLYSREPANVIQYQELDLILLLGWILDGGYQTGEHDRCVARRHILIDFILDV